MDFEFADAADLSDETWQEIADVIYLSFEEHRKNGLTMMPCSITSDELKERAVRLNATVLLVKSGGRINGVCIASYRDLGTDNAHVFYDIIAVHPNCKRMGVCKQINAHFEQNAVQKGCRYALTDISYRAASSRRCHSANGFEICGYAHFGHANYISVLLRKDLCPASLPDRLLRKIKRPISYIKTRIRWTHEGRPTRLVYPVRWLKHFCKGSNPPPKESDMKLEEIQKVSLDILKEFAAFCEKRGLRYLLAYGTLLGAIRHKGFIPWDDDIDVTMPLPDFDRFVKEWPEYRENSHLEVLLGKEKCLSAAYSMLVDNRIWIRSARRDEKHSHYMGIDIFPAHQISDDDDEVYEQIKIIRSNLQESFSWLRRSIRNPKKMVRYWLHSDSILRRCLSTVDKSIRSIPWGSTKRVRFLAIDEDSLMAMPSNVFDDYIEVPFEDTTFRAPRMYHENLTEAYGDYMTPMPKPGQQIRLDRVYRIKGRKSMNRDLLW